MSYAYLIDPENQYMTLSGTINVGGFLRVFDASTDDPAVTYSDFDGTENQQDIVLDNNGRAVVIADPDRVYRLEVYDRYGKLMWTTTPLWCQGSAGGAGSSSTTEIVSSSGSIDVTKTTVGSTTTYDISVAQDSAEQLDWIRTEGYTLDGSIMVPTYQEGPMEVGQYGIALRGGNYYHVTARLRASVTAMPVYNEFSVTFSGMKDGEIAENYLTRNFIADCSTELHQDYEVSFDVHPGENAELYATVSGLETGVSVGLMDIEVHRVYSGIPSIPDGMATKDWVRDNYQPTLTAGDNIDITDNVISAIVPEFAEADWDASSGEPGYIHNKPELATVALTGSYDDLSWRPDLSVYATLTDLAGKQDVLTAGANIVIEGDTISATAEPQLNADWDASSGVQEILHKPDLSVYAEKSELASVATTGSYESLTDKPTIPAAQVQTDWDAPSGISAILHRPDLSVYELVANKKQSIDADSTTDFPSSKATADFVNSSVATNTAKFLGNYTLTDLGLTYGATNAQIATALDGYTWPVGTTPTNNDYVYVEIQNPQTTGIDDVVRRFKYNGTNWAYEYTLNNSSFTAEEKAAIDSGITSSDVSAYNAHIADTDIHVTTSDKSTWNGKQDAIADLSDIRSGAAAGATAVQPGDLATVAITGDYADLLNKPTIPTATSDLTNDSGFITLSDVPAQVNSDWDASSGVAQILNRPEEATLVAGDNITITESGSTITISGEGGADWDATSGQSGFIKNKPDLSIYAQSANLATVATTGSYNSLTDQPTIPAAQVQTDWDATSGMGELLNKPDLVDIVAGPGIVVDNPDGNTLRVSMDSDYEVELYYNASGAPSVTLSESAANFERIKVWVDRNYYTGFVEILNGRDGIVYHGYGMGETTWVGMSYALVKVNGTTVSLSAGCQCSFTTAGAIRYINRGTYGNIIKVVGVKRIAGGN